MLPAGISSLRKNWSVDRFDGGSLLAYGFSDGRSNSDGIFVAGGLEKRLGVFFGRVSLVYFDSLRRFESCCVDCDEFDSDLCVSRERLSPFSYLSVDELISLAATFWSIAALSMSTGSAGGGSNAFSGSGKGGGGGGACINSAMMLSEMFVESAGLEWIEVIVVTDETMCEAHEKLTSHFPPLVQQLLPLLVPFWQRP